MDLQAPDPAGPPPPPFVRERRARRRRWVLIGSVTGVLLLGVAVGVVLLTGDGEGADPPVAEDPEDGPSQEGDDPDDGAASPEDEQPPDGAEDPPPGAEGPTDEPGADEGATPRPGVELDLDAAGRPDREVPADEQLVLIDPQALDADQRPVAELLLDIDASERSMLGFQLDVGGALDRLPDLDGPEDLDSEIRSAAAHALEALAVLRERMQAPQDDPWAEQVREAYVIHLDSWVRYLEAVYEDPQVLFGDTTRFTLDINRTGGGFTRAVEGPGRAALDDEVVRLADELVARGFPPPEDSQV